MEKDKEIYNKCAPMMELPYQSKKNILPDKNYIVMLTYLPLARYRSLPQFLHFVFRIVLQLQKSPGLVGYTLRAGVLKKQFWTLSIWEDSQSVYNFISRHPHLDAMSTLQGKMGKTAFHQWSLKGDILPLSWKAALTKAQG